VDWQIFQKIPGYFRITWVNPDTKMTPKTKKNIQNSSYFFNVY
jgi:hypothetical protein